MIVLKAKRHKKLLVALIVVISLIGALFIAGAVYVSDYYHADDEAINAFMPMHDISVCELDDGITVFSPEGAKAGLIFYPGGKVEHSAYAPLMAACASEGVMCVLVQMPFNLAVLDINAADGIQEQFPEISEWYIGGHSLGGSMAASYAAKHQDEFCGLVLLAAYSTADLTESGLKVL